MEAWKSKNKLWPNQAHDSLHRNPTNFLRLNCQMALSPSKNVMQIVVEQSVWLCLRLFQHTFGAHPEQLLPTGYKGIPFIVGVSGIAWGVL